MKTTITTQVEYTVDELLKLLGVPEGKIMTLGDSDSHWQEIRSIRVFTTICATEGLAATTEPTEPLYKVGELLLDAHRSLHCEVISVADFKRYRVKHLSTNEISLIHEAYLTATESECMVDFSRVGARISNHARDLLILKTSEVVHDALDTNPNNTYKDWYVEPALCGGINLFVTRTTNDVQNVLLANL